MELIVAIIALLWANLGLSSTTETYLPENDLWQEDTFNNNNSITEQSFSQIIDSVTRFYFPLATGQGATLTIVKRWTDSTVNAYAQQSGKTWMVTMYGGLARRPEVTPDGFAMVVCHELGHHFGGFPFYGDGEWAATEGQADYFATHVCAKKIWADQAEENARYRTLVPESVKAACDGVYSAEKAQDICYRTAKAGLSLATLNSVSSGRPPRFDTPDQRRVTTTYTKHPNGQCRLDTYYQGALCPVAWRDEIIPSRAHRSGQTSVEAERNASLYSCTTAGKFTVGLRPRCWFAPKL